MTPIETIIKEIETVENTLQHLDMEFARLEQQRAANETRLSELMEELQVAQREYFHRQATEGAR